MDIESYLQEIVLRVYCLSLTEISEYSVFAALIFCSLYRKYGCKLWMNLGLRLALGAWFAVALWITLFSRDRGAYSSTWFPLHTYWQVFMGGSDELLRNSLMNVVLFYPAGLLLGGMMPQKWSFRRGMLYTVLVFMLFSLSIELCQYFLQLGTAEIDDVLHNTLGAGLGYAAFHLDLDDISRNNRR